MASTNTTPRIVGLAAKISTSVAELQELLSAQGVPSPSFDEDSPERLPPNTLHLQDAVLDATAELNELLMEPIPLAFKFSATTNMISIDAICRFHIADIVPPGGQVSFGEIAKQTGLDEPLVRRLLRHAMSMRILREPGPGMVAHTKISKLLTIPYVNDWLSFGAQEGWPAATRMLDAIQKWPSSEESNTTVKLLVQDMEMVVAGAESGVPDEFKDRIEFKAHGLFDTQSVQADVYFFRLVFQLWADKYALRILKAQIPALRPGAKILIRDSIMPEPGDIPLWRDRELRSMDLNVASSFNGRIRYLHEWEALLVAADKRFVLQRVIASERSLLSTLEIV